MYLGELFSPDQEDWINDATEGDTFIVNHPSGPRDMWFAYKIEKWEGSMIPQELPQFSTSKDVAERRAKNATSQKRR